MLAIFVSFSYVLGNFVNFYSGAAISYIEFDRVARVND